MREPQSPLRCCAAFCKEVEGGFPGVVTLNGSSPVTRRWYLWFLGQAVMSVQSEQAESVCMVFSCACARLFTVCLSNEFISLEELQPNWMRQGSVTYMFSTALLWGGQDWEGLVLSHISQLAPWPRGKVHLSRESVNPIACCRWTESPLTWIYFTRHPTSNIDYFFPAHLLFLRLVRQSRKQNNGKVVKLDPLKRSWENSVALTSMFWAKWNVKIDFRKNMFFNLLF